MNAAPSFLGSGQPTFSLGIGVTERERISTMNSQTIKLREHRKARGLTMRQLATAAGTHPATICHIENRKMERVYDPTLAKLAKGLGVTIGELAWPPGANAREDAVR